MEYAVILGSLIGILLSVVDAGIVQPCVVARKPALETAVAELVKVPAADRCSAGLTYLKEIKEHLDSCEDLQENDPLKRGLGEDTVRALVAVPSADNYCNCLEVVDSAEKIDLSKAQTTDPDHGFETLPNFGYICSGSTHGAVVSLSQSLDACKQLIQVRMPGFSENSTMAFKNLGLFAQKHCYMVNKPGFAMDSQCVLKRARMYGYRVCLDLAQNYKEEEARRCGERYCIFRSMETCPEEWKTFYIDAVNVYAAQPIPDKRCPSSAGYVTASVLSVISMVTALFLL